MPTHRTTHPLHPHHARNLVGRPVKRTLRSRYQRMAPALCASWHRLPIYRRTPSKTDLQSDDRTEPAHVQERPNFKAEGPTSQAYFGTLLVPWRACNKLSQSQNPAICRSFSRVSDGIRTRDRRDHNPELYQLSYAHQVVARSLATREGRPPRRSARSRKACDQPSRVQALRIKAVAELAMLDQLWI
jgi:hypothetical protein